MFRRIPILPLVLLVACSSDNFTVATCNQTFTGSISATSSCYDPVIVWEAGNGKATFSIPSSSSPTTTATIVFTGVPTVRSYTIADRNGDLGGINLQSQYLAGLYFPTSGTVVTSGAYTLTVTSVDNYSTTVTEKWYHVHGTIDATLAGLNGTPGTVIYHATF